MKLIKYCLLKALILKSSRFYIELKMAWVVQAITFDFSSLIILDTVLGQQKKIQKVYGLIASNSSLYINLTILWNIDRKSCICIVFEM